MLQPAYRRAAGALVINAETVHLKMEPIPTTASVRPSMPMSRDSSKMEQDGQKKWERLEKKFREMSTCAPTNW